MREAEPGKEMTEIIQLNIHLLKNVAKVANRVSVTLFASTSVAASAAYVEAEVLNNYTEATFLTLGAIAGGLIGIVALAAADGSTRMRRVFEQELRIQKRDEN